MSRRTSAAILILAAAMLLAAATSLAAGQPGAPEASGAPEPRRSDDAPTDQLVVRPAAGASLDEASLAVTAGVPVRHLRRLGDGSYVVKLPRRGRSGDAEAIAARLATRADVASAEPDALMKPLLTPNDALFASQWDLAAPASGTYGASLPGAWDLTTGSASIVVGVIDTGYLDHADLAGRFVAGYDFVSDPAVANDGGGRDPDAHDPGDWVTAAESASGTFAGCGASNSSWHGTHVSGTIGAAGNNALGVAGVNWVSRIQPLRVLGKCGGYTSDIADAIRWGAGLPVAGLPANPTPARVLNISLGGSGLCSSTYQQAIDAAVAAGTVVVVAAGNSNGSAGSFQPANCANVITVAATGHTGSRAYYSNYGSAVEIAAPGGDATLGRTILSTLNTGTTVPATDGYASYQGTSMATPHVVGVASLVLSVAPSLTPAAVASLLQSAATPFPAGSTCSTATCGAGIVNAAAAVAAATGTTPPPPPPPPARPAAFAKLAPASGATGVSRTLTLSWQASSGATSYEVCVSRTSGSCAGWTTVSRTSFTVSGLSRRTTYSWQVRARNTAGVTDANAGAWWSFRTA